MPLPSSISSCRIVWSTQSGRAKACARRTARILGERTTVELEGGIGTPFDETPVPFLELLASPPTDGSGTLILMFVSTTGDGEQCDSIRNTWKSLLQKSLPRNMLAESKHQFALFCLGDRAYGPQFCAAGRKLAVRLLQLGLPSFCEVGYGDDNTPNGGIFRDLDDWLEDVLLPKTIESSPALAPSISISEPTTSSCPYRVQVIENIGESNTADLEAEFMDDSYRDYFSERGPIMAYSYESSCGNRIASNVDIPTTTRSTPLLGIVVVNERITDSDWKQDTRHIEIQLAKRKIHVEGVGKNVIDNEESDASNEALNERLSPLPYMAGDVASVLPFNSLENVNRFLSVVPDSISSLADSTIQIDLDESYATDNRYTRWPCRCTLRGWLTYCADIQSLPEREDLRALSVYCAPRNDGDTSLDQGEKLRSFSETEGAALYADYVLREKRSWIDVLYDFESLREPGSLLTLEALLMILPPMRPRDFSIASAPSMGMIRKKDKRESDVEDNLMKLFSIELCVAVVEGTTRLGRSYYGLCSKFLSQVNPFRSAIAATDNQVSSGSPSQLLVWIRPGTFGKMPMQFRSNSSLSFEVPILCVGAGTGVAPMRSLLLERVAIRFLAQKREEEDVANDSKIEDDIPVITASSIDEDENILIFGCRKQKADYYFEREWETLTQENHIRVLTAFSQDQMQKMYVQKILRDADDGSLIAVHILERGGAVFIAGNPKMARAVKQEIIEVLSDSLPGGEKQANKLLNRMQRMGRFSIEAW